MGQSEHDDERELFSRVVELLRRHQADPRSKEARTRLADATRELEQFRKSQPDSLPALRLLAECAQRLSDFKSAREYIYQAELLDPWNLEILIISESLHEMEANLPRKQGEPLRLRSEITSGVINAEKLLEKAMGMMRLGELERGYSLAKLAYTLGPESSHHLMDVLAAGSCFDPERTRRELTHLEQAGEAPPFLYLALGSICNVLGLYPEAVNWLGKGLSLAPEDRYVLAMLNNELAYVLIKQGIELDRCVALARTALELFPNRRANGFIRDTLGVAYLKRGDIAKAVQNLREAVAKDPTVIPRFHLALAMLKNKEPASALAELKQIAAARPSLESPHVEEIAILERVQTHIARLQDLLNLGGTDDVHDALVILDGLV
jgi:tetratricopeptide (TPR) repeat protein